MQLTNRGNGCFIKSESSPPGDLNLTDLAIRAHVN
jgi:hypothetical protein